jgi:hypothetical protein
MRFLLSAHDGFLDITYTLPLMTDSDASKIKEYLIPRPDNQDVHNQRLQASDPHLLRREHHRSAIKHWRRPSRSRPDSLPTDVLLCVPFSVLAPAAELLYTVRQQPLQQHHSRMSLR